MQTALEHVQFEWILNKSPGFLVGTQQFNIQLCKVKLKRFANLLPMILYTFHAIIYTSSTPYDESRIAYNINAVVRSEHCGTEHIVIRTKEPSCLTNQCYTKFYICFSLWFRVAHLRSVDLAGRTRQQLVYQTATRCAANTS